MNQQMVIALSAESVFQSAKWSKPIEVGNNTKRLPKKYLVTSNSKSCCDEISVTQPAKTIL